MNGQNTSTTRGTIIKVPDATPGILLANGQQQSFTLERVWKSPMAPAVNMTVDVEMDASGAIQALTVVEQHQVTKERLNQLGGVAQERGKEAAKLAQQGIGALAARMGAIPLGAAVLVWISWFFLPAASLGGAMVGSTSLTFWNLLGTDFNDPRSMMGAGSSHGFLSLLGILAIAAPFVVPFLKFPWAKYLNAAPLAIVIIGFLATWMGESKAFGDLAKMVAPNPFSWSWGIFILALAALVLAVYALKPPARA